MEWETSNDEGDKKDLKLEQILVLGKKKSILSHARSEELNGEINSLFCWQYHQTDTSFPHAVLPLLLDCDHFKGWQRRCEYV